MRSLLFVAAFGLPLVASGSPAGIIETVAGGGVGDGQPAVAQALNAESIAVDAAGNVFVAEGYHGRVRRVDAGTGVITTVAGRGPPPVESRSGQPGQPPYFCGDDGPAIDACIVDAAAVAVDRAGNVFVADAENHRVRRIDALTGTISTIAGGGGQGTCGDGGAAADACLAEPRVLFVDRDGNIFIADGGKVRRVDALTHAISSVAGGGTASCDEGGPAGALAIDYPGAVAVDPAGNLFVADIGNAVVCRVDAQTHLTSVVVLPGPGARAPLAVDAAGNLFVGAEQGDVERVEAGTQAVSTFAGNGLLYCTDANLGDGGPATDACLGGSVGLASGATGDLYIATQNRVRRVDATTHHISTVAGNGTPDVCGEGGLATDACLGLFSVDGVAVSPQGDLFITGDTTATVWRVDHATHTLTTIAGYASPCDPTPPTATCLGGLPSGVGVDPAGNVLIALGTDGGGAVLRMDPDTRAVSVLTGGHDDKGAFCGDGGSAADACVYEPSDVALDGAGNVLIADQLNARIRRIDATTGAITTIAGSGHGGYCGDGGPATAACLARPSSVAVDRADNIYIADLFNHRIRRVDAATGTIDTVAGNGTRGFCGDGGPARSACLDEPASVRLDVAGNLYIADSLNARVRRVDAGTGTIETFAGNGNGGWCGDGDSASGACLSYPAALAIDDAGNLFIGDRGADRVRRVACAPDTDGDGLCDTYDLSDVGGLTLGTAAVGTRSGRRGARGYATFVASLSMSGYPPAGDAANFFAQARAGGFTTRLYATPGPPDVRDRPVATLAFAAHDCRFKPAAASIPKHVRCANGGTSLRITRGRGPNRFSLRGAGHAMDLHAPASGPLYLTFAVNDGRALDLQASIGATDTGGLRTCAPVAARRAGVRCKRR